MKQVWRKIPCRETELQLEPTLNGGQSFRWKKSTGGIWTGVFKDRVWLLQQEDDYLTYQCHKGEKTEPEEISNQSSELTSAKRKKVEYTSDEEDESLLKNYLRLNVNLGYHYQLWSDADPHFKKSAATFYGIRILNQDVVENLFSFICSSNNNIIRISTMVEKLCKFYGNKITEINGIHYYTFPEIDRLCSANIESDLRKAGFGYRAKFIHQSACLIKKYGGAKWLEDLKLVPYIKAKKELMQLPGIGPKVADCICLMSLGHLEAIPVDTHIFQVASEIYLPHLKGCKSVTERIYNEISTYFYNLFGDKAGWAHTILFCSQLRAFKKEGEKKKKKGK